MDVREKLVELLGVITCSNTICNFCEHFQNKSACERHKKEVIADHLITHGVTVQEWISVKDRLPEKDGGYLVVINYFGNHQSVNVRSFAKVGETVHEYDLAGEKNVWYSYDSEYGYVSTDSVTHWMPLPEPPKGE